MGRYTSDTGGGQPRKKTIKLFASDPAVAVPAWAGVVYVTGCGGGQGGGNSTNAGMRGGGGGAGGYCVRAPLPLSAVQTISVIVPAGGLGAVGSSGAFGTPGGHLAVAAGQLTLTCEGGRDGVSPISGGFGGRAVIGGLTGVSVSTWTQPLGASGDDAGLGGSPSPFSTGARGGDGNSQAAGWGAGAFSPFGASGAGLTSAPAANAGGADASGYGAGGAGSHGTGKAGDGSPGFVMLEFEETA